MRHAILCLIFLCACNEPGGTASLKASPGSKIVFFGDQTLADSNGLAEELAAGGIYKNLAVTWDGTNSSMLFGLQILNQWPAGDPEFHSGDKAVIIAGHYDGMWYGAQDPQDATLHMLPTFLNQLLAADVEIYIATVPHLPSYAIASPLNNGSDAACDLYSDVIRTVVTNLNDPRIHLVDLNHDLTADPAYYTGGTGPGITTAGADAIAQLFLNAAGL